jgi:transcriptional regulator with GAF, ATPase, and Fis domain
MAGVEGQREVTDLEAPRDPHELLSILRDITATLACRTDVDGLMAGVVRHGQALHMKAAVMWGLVDDELHLVASSGYGSHDLERFARLPLTANMPCSDAVVEHRPVVCGDPQTLFGAYPLIERLVGQTRGLVALPLQRQGVVVGGLSLHFRQPVVIDSHMMVLLQAIADLAAVAYDPDSTPLAPVYPLTVVRTNGRVLDLREEFNDDTSEEEAAEESLEDRLNSLERQVRSVRQVMLFLGAIASDRFDDGR